MARTILYLPLGLLLGAFVGAFVGAFTKADLNSLFIYALCFALIFGYFGVRAATWMNGEGKTKVERYEVKVFKNAPWMIINGYAVIINAVVVLIFLAALIVEPTSFSWLDQTSSNSFVLVLGTAFSLGASTWLALHFMSQKNGKHAARHLSPLHVALSTCLWVLIAGSGLSLFHASSIGSAILYLIPSGLVVYWITARAKRTSRF